MARIEILRQQLEKVEKRKAEVMEEIAKMKQWTYREKWENNPTSLDILKAQQRVYLGELIKREYKHLKGREDELFNIFINAFLDEKVRNLKEFIKQYAQ